MNFTNVYGLTGYYCSGKSTVEKILEENLNFFIIDLDKIGHMSLIHKQDEIVQKFGNIILSENKINRKILGKIVFNDKTKLNDLNNIVHPWMVEKVKEIIYENKDKKILIDGALIFQMKLDEICSKIFIIKANFLTILKRGKKRDGHSLFRIIKILISQKKHFQIKQKKSDADILYIKNNGNLAELIEKLKTII